MNGGRLRVLVVGAGSIGLRHADLLGALEGVEARVLPARPGRVAELAAKGYPAVHRAEAERFKPQAVVVATETAGHVAEAAAWLDRGAWVLVEKPLAPTLDAAAVLGAQPRLRVACCFRADEGIQWLRSRVGALGVIHAVRVEAQSYLPDWRPGRDPRSGYAADPLQGGVLRDLIHEVDYTTWIFGFPGAVQGHLQDGGRLGLACDAGADLGWSMGDARLTLRLDYLTRPGRRTIRVDGEGGTLEVDLQGRVWAWRGEGPARVERGRTPRDAMYFRQMEAFLALARGEGDALPLADLGEARKALALLDAARASAGAGGAAVALREVP